jgi:DNA-binding response OmpR family regulator
MTLDTKRVLIVDDDRAIGELISTRLGVLGFETRHVLDGLAAMSRIKDFRPHALILDINMPMMDGFSVMAQLGRDRLQTLPTLVLTARHQAEDVKRAIELGARDYLAKPFDEAKLLQRVARLFRRAQA